MAEAASGVAMLVPDDGRRLLLFDDQNPSPAAEEMVAPGARTNTPSVPASVGPYDEDDQRSGVVDLVLAPTEITLRPLAGSRMPSPLFPGAMTATDHGIAFA